MTTRHDARLRAAMTRLLRGESLHTDGKLTKTNLAREAGVQRQTLYRSDVLKEFEEHVERVLLGSAAPGEGLLAEIAHLKDAARRAERRAREYRSERDERAARAEAMACRLRVADAQIADLERRLSAAHRLLTDSTKVTPLPMTRIKGIPTAE